MKLPRPTININRSSIFNVLGVLMVAYLLVVLASTVKRNYDLGRQISNLNNQITFLNDQKDELSYSLQYYNTDSFRDREARSKLGLQLPGENVVIIPHPTASPGSPAAAPAPTTPHNQSNIRQWLDFLAGRSS